MRDWSFTLHLQEPLTPEQSDTLDGLDSFNDGRMSLVEGPGWAKFSCIFESDSLNGAIVEALSLFQDFPGLLVRSVALPPIQLERNDMMTPAVVPAPPPLEEAPPGA
ncbi:hypothetical protein ABT354_21805 [Streptomyces sp. NPDC000594]|uniref:hypothetical protein n=1 Tax=Streptomyces sp. NPDC000594 TaxID=3154261 RepID=UPI003322AEEB